MFPSEVIVLDKLPLLGSGKPDLVALQKFVASRRRPRRRRRNNVTGDTLVPTPRRGLA